MIIAKVYLMHIFQVATYILCQRPIPEYFNFPDFCNHLLCISIYQKILHHSEVCVNNTQFPLINHWPSSLLVAFSTHNVQRDKIQLKHSDAPCLLPISNCGNHWQQAALLCASAWLLAGKENSLYVGEERILGEAIVKARVKINLFCWEQVL